MFKEIKYVWELQQRTSVIESKMAILPEMWLCSSFHPQEIEFTFPSLVTGLAFWTECSKNAVVPVLSLDLKRPCTGLLECASTCSLGMLSSWHINKTQIASWRMRDHMQQAEAFLDQPSPVNLAADPICKNGASWNENNDPAKPRPNCQLAESLTK